MVKNQQKWVVLAYDWMTHIREILEEWKRASHVFEDHDLVMIKIPVPCRFLPRIPKDILKSGLVMWLSFPWAIPVRTIGRLWDEDGLQYDPHSGLWCIKTRKDVIFRSVHCGYFIPTSTRQEMYPPLFCRETTEFLTTIDGLSHVSTRFFNQDYIYESFVTQCRHTTTRRQCVEHFLKTRPQEWMTAVLFLRFQHEHPDLIHTPKKNIHTLNDIHIMRLLTMSEIVCRSTQRHQNHTLEWMMWKVLDAFQETPALSLFLRLFHETFTSETRDTPPTLSTLVIPMLELSRKFYLEPHRQQHGDLDMIRVWTQTRVWSSLVPSVKEYIRETLLFYIPVLSVTCDTAIGHVLDDTSVPRLSHSADRNERYSIFNPCVMYDATTKTFLCNLRTANYCLETYRSRDMNDPVVRTKNFCVRLSEKKSLVQQRPQKCRELTIVSSVDELFLDRSTRFLLTPHHTHDPLPPVVPKKQQGRRLDVRGIEDIRWIEWPWDQHGLCFFLGNACDRPKKNGLPVVVCGVVNPDTGYTRVITLDYGDVIEKNWMPLTVHSHKKALVVYSLDPCVLLDITPLLLDVSLFFKNDGFTPRLVFQEHPISRSFHHDPFGSQLRGSGGFIWIEKDTTCIGLVHQVVFTQKTRRRKYLHRFVKIRFGHDTVTWTHINITLSQPFVFLGSHMIQYALGLTPYEWTTDPHRDCTSFLISYSVNDNDARVCIIEKKSVDTYFQDDHPQHSKHIKHIDVWMGSQPTRHFDPFVLPSRIAHETARHLLVGWPRHTYVINRDCDTERWTLFQEHVIHPFSTWFDTHDFFFHRVSAIDGASPSFSETWPWSRYIRPHHRQGTKHENLKTLALTLSHFKTLDTILSTMGSESTEWVMVCEDDATLLNMSRWPVSFGEMIKQIPCDVGLCALGRLFPIEEERYTPLSLFEPLRFYGTTLSYLVRPCAIPKMLERVLTVSPIPSLGVSDAEIYGSCPMKTLMTRFPFMTCDTTTTTSTIHRDHESYQEKCRVDFLTKNVFQDRTVFFLS